MESLNTGGLAQYDLWRVGRFAPTAKSFDFGRKKLLLVWFSRTPKLDNRRFWFPQKPKWTDDVLAKAFAAGSVFRSAIDRQGKSQLADD